MKAQIKTAHGYLSFQPAAEGEPLTVQYRATPGTWEELEIIGWDLPVPEPPPEPEPTPPPIHPDADPIAIISGVWATGHHELVTKDGCGQFTEACCTALHLEQSPLWGHIEKVPGQNQYNGHATDAVMLLARAGGTDPGIYDIIQNSESADAAPSFNYKGEPEPELWYYPASSQADTVTRLYDAIGAVLSLLKRL